MTEIYILIGAVVLCIALVGGIVTVARVVVKMAPTPKDDAALAVVVKALNFLALNPKK